MLPTPTSYTYALYTLPYGFTHTRRHTRQDSVSGVKPESEDTRETYTCGVCVSVCVGGWPWCVVAQQWHKLEAAPRARARGTSSLSRVGDGVSGFSFLAYDCVCELAHVPYVYTARARCAAMTGARAHLLRVITYPPGGRRRVLYTEHKMLHKSRPVAQPR